MRAGTPARQPVWRPALHFWPFLNNAVAVLAHCLGAFVSTNLCAPSLRRSSSQGWESTKAHHRSRGELRGPRSCYIEVREHKSISIDNLAGIERHTRLKHRPSINAGVKLAALSARVDS
jgi:hypothetical protein